jgi:hypothetical protein
LSLYFWAIEFTVASVTALLIASWLIGRESRASRERENFERRVLSDNLVFRDELIIAVRDEITNATTAADSTKQAITTIAHMVLRAVTEIDTRLDKLKDRTDEISGLNDEYRLKIKASEILQLRTAVDKLTAIQKITEQRLSDEIRFDLDRAKVTDASLRGFAGRMEQFAEDLNELIRKCDHLSALVASPKEVNTPDSKKIDLTVDEKQAAIDDHAPALPPSILDHDDQSQAAVYPSDEAA